MRKLTIAAVAAIIGLAGLTACTDDSVQNDERAARQSGYEKASKRQPAHVMKYSPTRETISKWGKTWEKEGKLSYVYLLNSMGDTVGYYVLKGLPVSYCASLTPTWDFTRQDGKYHQVPAPGIDQVYYGNSGGLCSTYYGFDATTGAYIEYTTGQGINALLYDQPLPRFEDAKPLGQTSTKDVK